MKVSCSKDAKMVRYKEVEGNDMNLSRRGTRGRGIRYACHIRKGQGVKGRGA